MKNLVTASLGLLFMTSALAFDVDIKESTINEKLQAKFPMTVKNVTFSHPNIQIKNQTAEFCSNLLYQGFGGVACGDIVLLWNASTSTLMGTVKSLNKFKLDNGDEAPRWLIDIINIYAIPHTPPFAVYKNDSWIASKIDKITLKPKIITVTF